MARVRNLHAVRSLSEVAVIMHERGLIPAPSAQNVAAYEASAFRKIRQAWPELELFLDGDSDATERGVCGSVVDRW